MSDRPTKLVLCSNPSDPKKLSSFFERLTGRKPEPEPALTARRVEPSASASRPSVSTAWRPARFELRETCGRYAALMPQLGVDGERLQRSLLRRTKKK